MRIRKIVLILISAMVLIVFTACEATDLVAKVAVTSFDKLTSAIPDQVVYDSTKSSWSVSGPDGGEKLLISKDFNSSQPDMELEFNAEPFIQAGLDISKLPAARYVYDKSKGTITMPFEYGNETFKTGSDKTALGTFKQVVKTHRSIIGYHEEGDHYMISLGDGNTFAWAKDLGTNKKDLLFILNPKPFVDAGMNPGKLTGWVAGKLPVTDKDGKTIQLDRIIKAFNIK